MARCGNAPEDGWGITCARRPLAVSIPSVPGNHLPDYRGLKFRIAHRSRSFTVLELVIVMGILLILSSLFFVGFSYMANSQRAADTRATLATAMGMLQAYEQATSYSKNPPIPMNMVAGTVQGSGGFTGTDLSQHSAFYTTAPNFISATPWLTHSDGTTSTNGTAIVELAPGTDQQFGGPTSITMSALSNELNGPSMPVQVLDTAAVMYVLESIPANSRIVASLPSSKTWTVTVWLANTSGLGGPTQVTTTLLLDSWGNPILFVPGYGVAGVAVSGAVTYNSNTTYSRGTRAVYDEQTQPEPPTGTAVPIRDFFTWVNQASGININPPAANPFTIVPYTDPNWGGLCAPDLRPFFVSAGPDGDISKGDDNVYSYEQ